MRSEGVQHATVIQRLNKLWTPQPRQLRPILQPTSPVKGDLHGCKQSATLTRVTSTGSAGGVALGPVLLVHAGHDVGHECFLLMAQHHEEGLREREFRCQSAKKRPQQRPPDGATAETH